MVQLDIFQASPPLPKAAANPRGDRHAPLTNDGRGRCDTSRDALAEHRSSGKLGAQQQIVYAALTKSGQAWTRAELAAKTGLPVASICGRVRELLDLQMLVEEPRRPCSVSRKNAHPVRAR